MRSTLAIKVFVALWPFLLCLSQAENVFFSSLPSCAQACINSTVTCHPYSNASCLCQNAPLLDQTKDCWRAFCTRKQDLRALNITSIVCEEPVEDKSESYRRTVAIFYALAVLAVVAHLAGRFAAGQLTWVYDGHMLVIACLGTALDVLQWKVSETGLGKHIWQVPDDDVTATLRYFYFVEVGYFVILGLIKLQFLIFYLQIFPDQTFRRIVYAVLIFQAVSLLPFAVSAIFICTPISYTWTSWTGKTSGTCISNNALVFAHAGLHIFFDVVTLLLPMKPVWALQLSITRKIALTFMFGIGAFVTAISIVRMTALVSFAANPDTTWNYLETSRWSTLETHIALICLCMPAIRLGFVRLARRYGLLSISSTSGKSNSRGYSRNGGRRLSRPKISDIHVQSTFRIGHSSKGHISEDERSLVQLVEIKGDKKGVESV